MKGENPQPAFEREAAASKKAEPLYQPLNFLTVRAPLLPVEAYFALADEKRQSELLSDPRVLTALAVGSTSLLAAIQRYKQSGLTPRDADRMRAKLRRYQIRMATRPTPYGLFAGVALAEWGEKTDVAIQSTLAKTASRPDMAWLMDLVMSAEADPAIRRCLSLVSNPTAAVEAGRVFLSERAPSRPGTATIPVSVKATGVVRRALEFARTPIAYGELVKRLCDATPSATTAKVEKLLDELWEQTLLLTDLRPPLTGSSPAHYVAGRLKDIPEAAEVWGKLNAMLGALANWDGMRVEERADGFRAILVQTGIPPDGSQQTPIQTDMAMSLAGRVGTMVAREAAQAAELLLRLSPSPRGIGTLAAYRQLFTNRYGFEREVPLREVLDPLRGLGPPPSHGHFSVGPAAPKSAQRARILTRLACTALRSRNRTILLDKEVIDQLETWQPNSDTAPVSLDINILVGGRSAAEIDRGEFTMVVGPNLGALSAGRNLGRFAGLLAPEGALALEQIAEAEQAHEPDELWAEAVYIPANFRLANVVIRPAFRTHELALGVTAGVSASRTIPFDQLVVGVEEGRFYVRWPAAGKRVRFSACHMLTTWNAPAAIRFLSELNNDGKAVFSTFDWGPAESFPFLPRVQFGRIVLRPAQWRIHKGDIATESPAAFRSGLDCWRAAWDVPRLVSLTVGDNRLILDLDHEAEAAELKAEILKAGDMPSITVQEVLPTLDEAWLQGPGGSYYSELIVSLVLSKRKKPASESKASGRTPASENAKGLSDASSARTVPGSRLRPPGSEWLFLKLYCPRNLENDIVPESMLTFAENAVAAGLADSWFFIRYSDPESHIRLRFHGTPERLSGHLFSTVCQWASSLMSEGLCVKFAFDTYEPEIERFGGAEGMALAESIFGADSKAGAKLLRELKRRIWPHDEAALLALSVDDLLSAAGFDESERLRWYGGRTNARGTATGSEFRQRKTVFRSVLGRPKEFLASFPNGSVIASAFDQRRETIAPAAKRLKELSEAGLVTESLEELCGSFVHLHLNRMSTPGSPSEQRILSLLLRTRESLAKAPVL